ncbi:MAG: rRNA maturation RNase YbeY [Anaerolineales bacterium]|nr:rRNA maturation RNase YbeY [Anaerolineales bacterium]MCS7248662.1 rRNA maturation RNase YbeY [Anaerolineales bacterium]MDW8162475.1 rRNA maturation RNase YbeY [Anaerolineales bacterium]MDW8447910.1 rRNA maturation RNase YbeY [Anaerolineales bacterium]
MIVIQKHLALPLHEWRAYKATLAQAAQAALAAVFPQLEGDLTLVLSSDDRIRSLNRQFRGFDAPTDVLSFPFGEINPQSGRKYLGDVVISLDRAREQAAAAGHSLSAELALLAVHGVLHLCGYDHEIPADKEQMWAVQEAILASLGIRISHPED